MHELHALLSATLNKIPVQDWEQSFYDCVSRMRPCDVCVEDYSGCAAQRLGVTLDRLAACDPHTHDRESWQIMASKLKVALETEGVQAASWISFDDVQWGAPLMPWDVYDAPCMAEFSRRLKHQRKHNQDQQSQSFEFMR